MYQLDIHGPKIDAGIRLPGLDIYGPNLTKLFSILIINMVFYFYFFL